jgi:hypothetical protein
VFSGAGDNLAYFHSVMKDGLDPLDAINAIVKSPLMQVRP